MTVPEAELFVHYAGALTEADIEWLHKRLPEILTEVVTCHSGGELSSLPELELTLVDDATLAEVHQEFLADPTVTDVITFPHGEILVSVDRAAQRAEEFGKGLRGETFLYLIHGILHLVGFDDKEPADAEKMACEQERIWAKFVD